LLDHDDRVAVLLLHAKGHGIKSIARHLRVSKNTVRKVLASGSRQVPPLERAESLDAHRERIQELFVACKGNRVRVHEELVAELAEVARQEGRSPPEIPYSTLTGYCRRHRIGVKPRKPSGEYHFDPGEEMQFDTSPHDVVFGKTKRRLQCASLVLCYSRKMFIQIYPTFNGFYARTFLSAAIGYFGASARRCMIDNSSVVVARGSGETAQFQPDLEALATYLGFEFAAHEVGDANRSARVERPFDYIERNFYPGRTFLDLVDLNDQALAWCERVNAKAPRGVEGSRDQRFTQELPFLKTAPVFIPEVYDYRTATVDVHGFVHLDRSRYSVPLEYLDRRLQVRKYLHVVRIFDGHQLVAEHPRFSEWERGRSQLPEHTARREGRSRWKRAPRPHEVELREAGGPFAAMLDALITRHGGRATRAARRLHRMYLDFPTELLSSVLEEALEFGLTDLGRIERMTLQRTRGEFFRLPPVERKDDLP